MKLSAGKLLGEEQTASAGAPGLQIRNRTGGGFCVEVCDVEAWEGYKKRWEKHNKQKLASPPLAPSLVD